MKKTIPLLLVACWSFFLIRCIDPKQNKNNIGSKGTTNNSIKTDTIANASVSSEITCPKCGYKKMEIMPTDQCLIKYTCEKCKTVLFPKEGDCCVFCSYGSKKCPSKQ